MSIVYFVPVGRANPRELGLFLPSLQHPGRRVEGASKRSVVMESGASRTSGQGVEVTSGITTVGGRSLDRGFGEGGEQGDETEEGG